ncbi:MAG: hypothetical protein ACFE0I_03835 [Elainellaceae cyanobacterium]
MLISIPVLCLLNSQSAVSSQPSTDTGDFMPIDTVLRLLDSEFLDAQQIFPDFVPDNLPVQIPLPDQARVLATVIYHATAVDKNLYRVLIEVPQPAEVAIAHYQDQLENHGWQLPSFSQAGSSGFIPTFNFQDTQRTFCNADESYSVLVSATPLADGLTSFDLTAFSNVDNPGCRASSIGADILETVPMPALGPPDGAQVSLTGSSSAEGPDYAVVTVDATIESELSAAAIAQHYATQWQAAGWSLQSEETNGSVKTIWMLEDEAGQLWQGTLTIDPAENSGVYSATATVETLQKRSHE